VKLSVVIRLRGAQLRYGTPRGENKKRTLSAVCSVRSGGHIFSQTVCTEGHVPYSKAVGGSFTPSTAEINNKNSCSALDRKLSWRLRGQIQHYVNVIKRPRIFLREVSGYGLQSWGLTL
jgi:hypothetical protein